jgi:hypothetical protein
MYCPQYRQQLRQAVYYTAHNETGRPAYEIFDVQRLPEYLKTQL